jgi:hypothetical protein
MDDQEKQLILDLSRQLLSRLAPKELPLARIYVDEYARNPKRSLNVSAGKDEVLAFGLKNGVRLMTPGVVLATATVVRELIRRLQALVPGGNVQQGTLQARQLLDPAQPTAPAQAIPQLTPEQIGELRAAAVQRLRQSGVPADEAQQLVAALLGRLGTA